MKKTIAAIAITLALAVTAVAQNESQHCYRRDGYNVCEFQPSGRVSVSWGDGDDYHSLWYTAKTWPAAHAQLKRIWERDNAEVQAFICSLQRSNHDMGDNALSCPPSPAKDTMEECLKNYKKQPWSAPGIAKNAQAQCTEEIRKAEEADRLEKQKQLRDAKAHAYDCTLAQSRGETLSDCPAAPKDTTEECKKHYAAHPWYVVKEDGTKVIDAEAACKETK